MNLQFHEKKISELPGETVAPTTGSLRIIFMGTPEFAVPSLKELYQSGYNIVGVVTAADKAAGRGLPITESAIKKVCNSKQIKNTTA